MVAQPFVRPVETSFDEATIQEFIGRVRGMVLRPDDIGYNEARAIQNGLIDRRPALIVHCLGVADVVEAVNFARDHDVLLSIRGGGHNVAGNAMNDGGLVIDLSAMRGVYVDPGARTVRVQGGATWGDVDRETQLFGLATPGGNVSTTGIAGLTLHGGIGNLHRKLGLSIDNVRSVEIVTADGQVRTASETENPDLFWAVRGAGSNFGVVTSFEFQLHPIGPLLAVCAIAYPLEDAERLLPIWRDYVTEAPDEVSSVAVIWSVPATEPFPPELHERPVLVLVAVHCGPVEEGERFLQPLRELAEPVLDLSETMPYTALQNGFDGFFPKGGLYYWKSRYLDRLDSETIAALVRLGTERPTPTAMVTIDQLGGAMSRINPAATAFGRRNAPYLLSLDTTWFDPAATERCIAWTRAAWTDMARFSAGGLYLNFAGFGEEKESLVRAGYGPNYERLVALKNRYDPTNLFRMNQNIKPTV